MKSRTIEEMLGKPLADLRREFLEGKGCLPRGLLEALAADPRAGARRLAAAIRTRRSAKRREGRRLRSMLRHEARLWDLGLERIAGVDEAGMAPLAGPVVAAAVILPAHYRLTGLDDSKKILNPSRREEMARQIKKDAVCWAVGRSEVEEIDRINIYHAGLLAMQRAVNGLVPAPDYALVDARRIPDCPCPQVGIVHGDALSASIAAASIIAKTARDALMVELDRIYPGYGLSSHKGYPTPEHCRILEERGALPIHRRSFGPVRKALRLAPTQKRLFEEPPP